jgi:class 3 adenylate cyclase
LTRPRTILFTDIQGSTRLTLARGDAGAMSLVRAHNDIVRRALRDTGGREVEHTGDGILASFFSVPEGIRCAVAVQREIARHNERAPADALHVRIGLSAGEPVVEGEDLFGSAVQLARRVCDYADADRILVSNIVHDLCIGMEIEFIARGEAKLKGFDTPERIHEVRWA